MIGRLANDPAIVRTSGLLIVTVALAVLATWVNPAFAEPANLRDLLIRIAPALIVSCGLTLVIVTGEIDISMGSAMGLIAAVMGLLASPSHAGLPVALVIIAAIALGCGIGLVNGVLVAFAGIPSIVATLGTLAVLRGLTELLLDGWITDLPAGLRLLGLGRVAGVPVPILVAALVTIAAVWFTRATWLGLRVYAVGSSDTSARLAGLRTRAIKLGVFAATGALTAAATLVGVPQLSVIDPGIGVGFELQVVSAVVVGGASLRGGSGAIAGTVVAVLLLGIVRSVLLFLDLGETATFWERSIQGALILAAVLADHVVRPRPALARA